jgi:RNA polymerase sigma factor (TIGR02999 family)
MSDDQDELGDRGRFRCLHSIQDIWDKRVRWICEPPGAPMSDVTHILNAIDQGDHAAAAQLLPLVYDELRQLAAAQLARERPGQTLEATALVHEAYLRLVGDQQFANRRHFFGAAAQAMRRILVESARRKQLAPRVRFKDSELMAAAGDERILELHNALECLAVEEPTAAKVVEARVFAGLSVEEAGAALGLSRAAAYREWTFARAWLAATLADNSQNP